MVLSIQGAWDGKRFAGIISSRKDDGTELWRATSREISVGPLVTSSERIFSIGSKGTDTFVPVLQAFDFEGRQLWAKEFGNLTEYYFSDIVATDDGVAVLAANHWSKSNRSNHAIVIKFSRDGQAQQTIPIAFPDALITSTSRLAAVGNALVVALNAEGVLKVDRSTRNKIGMPRVCSQNRFSTITQLHVDSLQITSTKTIYNFHTNVIAGDNNDIFLGGELFDDCSYRGLAAVQSIMSGNTPTRYWVDDGLFPSEVRGLAVGERMHIAVNVRRSFGTARNPANYATDFNDKRALESDSESIEAYLMELGAGGIPERKQYISAGFALFIQGLKAQATRVLAFGSLGGDPVLLATGAP